MTWHKLVCHFSSLRRSFACHLSAVNYLLLKYQLDLGNQSTTSKILYSVEDEVLTIIVMLIEVFCSLANSRKISIWRCFRSLLIRIASILLMQKFQIVNGRNYMYPDVDTDYLPQGIFRGAWRSIRAACIWGSPHRASGRRSPPTPAIF